MASPVIQPVDYVTTRTLFVPLRQIADDKIR
jgi:hypothetical protein